MVLQSSEWRKTTLGSIVDIYDYMRKPLSGKMRKMRKGVYPYYGASGIIDHIDDYIFDGKYLLIAEDGENLNSRKLPIAFFAEGNFWVNNHAHIVKARKNLADDYFILAWFHQANISGYITGAAQPKLSQENLKRIELNLPPLPIQRKIAAILSAYDDLIENNLRRIKILENMAQSLYHEWFVKYRFPGHENVRFVDSPLGKIPEGWEVTKLTELIKNHIGGGWGKENPDNSYCEKAWVIRGTDIPEARYCNLLKVPLRFHKKSNLKTRRLVQGDIIFEVSGGSKNQPLGRALLITPEHHRAFDGIPFIPASFCKRIHPESNKYASEIFYLSILEAYTSGEIEQFQVQSTGISNFKWSDYIERVVRCIPPIEIQKHFKEMVIPMFSEISTLGLKNNILRRTRDLLLPKLISGELDVTNIDITVPEDVSA